MIYVTSMALDRGTGLFLKFDMRHGAYRHETKYYRHDIGHSLNLTCDIKSFKNRHGNFKNSYRGHSHFLNSTCDIGDPRQGPHK